MMIDRTCENASCSAHFKAKSADVKRGWGRFCSKRCKAIQQERARHHTVVVARKPKRNEPSIFPVSGALFGPEFQFSE
jgi:hypothetical protein